MADIDALDMTMDLFESLRESLSADLDSARDSTLDDAIWYAEVFEKQERVFKSAVVFVAGMGGSL